MKYYMNTFINNTSFEVVKEQVTTKLGEFGFGIITEIDVKATMKKKLDVDHKNYVILGACNPHFAHEAIQMEDKIGVLLPCNVLVIEQADGRIEVAAMDPVVAMSVVDNPSLAETSQIVKDKLEQVINSF